MTGKKPYIKIMKDGPCLLFGAEKAVQKFILPNWEGISAEYADGRSFDIKPGRPAALCRCGQSKDAPFCDGAHTESPAFDGSGTAGFKPFSECAEVIDGPDVTLLDHENLCAFARFCDAGGQIWNLVKAGGPEATELAIREADLCPSGRLVILDKQGCVLGKQLPPGIGLLEDLALRISGPIQLTGNIQVESEDGQSYEVRMKQTLCRCGRSENKPFCDGRHAAEPGWCACYPSPPPAEKND